MCCFSGSVRSVGQTRIYARGLGDGRQALVYSMRLEIDSELAMVLPLPVPPGVEEDAVEFSDLSGCPQFFEHLEALFPLPGFAPAFLARGPAVRQTLEVKIVGDFEASFVPSRGDFARLDSRFRFPEDAFDHLPEYDDYGFAVFKLRPTKRGFFGKKSESQRVHPMAFSFPRRAPTELFFPTVHIHDGAVHDSAQFDHSLYCQPDEPLSRLLRWDRSEHGPGQIVSGAEAQGLIDVDEPVFRKALFGQLPNRDYRFAVPAHDVARLQGRGEHYEFEACCGWAFEFAPETRPHSTWKRTSERQFDKVQRNLFEGLPELCARHAADWKLRPLEPGLPPHFMNGPQLFRGTDYMNGTGALVEGPAAVAFTAFSEQVEPQRVVLGFSELPPRPLTDRISAELAALLDRDISSSAAH